MAQPIGLSLNAITSIACTHGLGSYLSTPTGVSAALFAVETAPTEGWCLQVRPCARGTALVGAVLTASFSAEPHYHAMGHRYRAPIPSGDGPAFSPPASSPQPSALSLNATASTNYTHSARRALPRTPLRPVLAWHRCPAGSHCDRCNPTRSPVRFRSPGPWRRKYPAR